MSARDRADGERITVSTGHTIQLRGGHLCVEGDLDSMPDIPEDEIEAYLRDLGYRCTWVPSGTQSWRVADLAGGAE